MRLNSIYMLILFSFAVYAEEGSLKQDTLAEIQSPFSKTQSQLPLPPSLRFFNQFRYTAEVGAIACRDAQGQEKGHIYYTYYRNDDALSRPITFAFNGGPGSSSIYLHLGAFGPKRLASIQEGQTAFPPYQWIDNTDSILDLTDLVFIDPIGTGFSRGLEQETDFYGIEEDIVAIGNFIFDFIAKEGRWNCAKYIAGESYGAIRAAGVSKYLLDQYSLYLNGLILISPALEYKTLSFQPDNELPYSLFLPTYATTAWASGRLPEILTLEEAARKARVFAFDHYNPMLLKLGKVPDSFYEEIANWTGLSSAEVELADGLIDDELFLTRFNAKQKQLTGRFDTRITGAFPLPRKIASYCEDPSITLLYGQLASSIHAYLRDELGIQEEWPRYLAFNEQVNLLWNTQGDSINILPNLRSALVQNPRMKLFAACGYFDLAVPFCTVEYSLNKLRLPHVDLTYAYYEGGHMFYADPAVLKQFKRDLIKFYNSQ